MHETVRLAADLGFKTVDAFAVFDRPQAPPEFVGVHNAPADFDERRDAATHQRDPVMQHCKRSFLPIVWDRNTYATAGCIDGWEEQASFGYRTGIVCALHLPHGVDRDHALPTCGR